VEDDRVARPLGSIEFEEVPALHRESVSERGYTQTLLMPLAVDSFVMGPFQSNCYVVRSERGASEAVVIDPGADPTELRLELARLGSRTAGILVTHTDVDHIGGVAALADGTGAEVWAPAGEVEALRSGETRGAMRVPPHEPAHTVTGGDEVAVAGLTFDVIDVPGHSAGHVAFHTDGELFSGDLLFAGSVGRVDLPGGDWETLLDSVRALLDRLPPETIVRPGHGPATTLGRELETNPFLRELRAERSDPAT
jgi:hydroxyacylglutathione hydrolase